MFLLFITQGKMGGAWVKGCGLKQDCRKMAMERFLEVFRRAGEDSDSDGEERRLLGSGEEGTVALF